MLRAKGLSYKQIAAKLGISERSVYRLKSGKGADSDMPVFFPQGTAHANQATRDIAFRVLASLGYQLTGWVFGVSISTLRNWRGSQK